MSFAKRSLAFLQEGAAKEISARAIVRSFIIDNFLLGASDDFYDHTQLMESGVIDSTAAMELVAFLDDTFGITIAEEEITPENLNSVDSICRFVMHKSG